MIAPDTNVLVRLLIADALHTATAATMSMEFHTFDTSLASKAEKLLGINVQLT